MAKIEVDLDRTLDLEECPFQDEVLIKILDLVKPDKVLLEVRPLSVSDTLDVSGTYLKIIIEPNRIILKFRFANIQILQKYDLYRIRIAI